MVALIRGNVLTVAWLGDSQAILVREGHGIQLVHPHKPDRLVSFILIFTLIIEVLPVFIDIYRFLRMKSSVYRTWEAK